MRLSSNADAAGYALFRQLLAEKKAVAVYLDGAEVKKVTIADEEEGFIVRMCTGADGGLLLTDDRQAAKTERLTGAVRIDITG